MMATGYLMTMLMTNQLIWRVITHNRVCGTKFSPHSHPWEPGTEWPGCGTNHLEWWSWCIWWHMWWKNKWFAGLYCITGYMAQHFLTAATPGNKVRNDLGLAPSIWNGGHGVYDDNCGDKPIDLRG
jgi:hypothetical protein